MSRQPFSFLCPESQWLELTSDFVQKTGDIVKPEHGLAGPRRLLHIVQLQQLSQVLDHLDIFIHETQIQLQKACLPAGNQLLYLLVVGRQVQVVAEGVEEGLGAELGEHALDVQVVGAAPLDLSTVVCQPGHKGASVKGAA